MNKGRGKLHILKLAVLIIQIHNKQQKQKDDELKHCHHLCHSLNHQPYSHRSSVSSRVLDSRLHDDPENFMVCLLSGKNRFNCSLLQAKAFHSRTSPQEVSHVSQ